MRRETSHMRYASMATAMGIIIFDLVTKSYWFARASMWTTLTPLLQTVHHRNYGLLFNLPAPPWFTVSVSMIVLLVAFYVLRARFGEARIAIGFGMIAGGAFGNVYDRLTLHFVRDWILVAERSAFNVADVAVIIGLLLILFSVEKTDTLPVGS